MVELPATIAGLQRALAQGRFTPNDAIQAQRQRLARLDRQCHAVVQTWPESEDASHAGPLAGVGLAHKDIFDTPGRRPGVGHGPGRPMPGLSPSPVTARLAQQGATQLASLAMAEYACGATGDNPHFPRCINPLHADAVVGGSSSGSAVAVASGMVYGSLGTDTAGSVRMPAATCGLLGLKTTHGLLPLAGVWPLAPSLDSLGVLGRTADDVVQLLEAASEPGRLCPAPEISPRLAMWLPEASLHADVAAAMHTLATACRTSVHADIDSHAALTHLAEIVLHTEAALTHHAALLDGSLSPAVEAVALPGLVLPPAWHAAAIADRSRRLREFAASYLQDHDILIIPALPTPMPDWRAVTPGEAAFDVRQLLAMHRFMGWINYLGLPSLVVPIALDSRGLPISVQLVGRPFHERGLLRCAAQIASQHFHMEGLAPSFSPEN